MVKAVCNEPAADSVSKIDHEVAVGDDLDFQRRWWRFERAIWVFFVLVIGLALAGAFGRGPLAKAEIDSADHALAVAYERIERTGTPSLMTVTLQSAARRGGYVEVFLSDSAVSGLGLQRVIPAPETTWVGNGGLTYRFSSLGLPAVVRFEFQPVGAGIYRLTVGIPSVTALHTTVAVVP